MSDPTSEANRFWQDASVNPVLADAFFRLGLKLTSSTTPIDDADSFFVANGYLTDTNTVITVYDDLVLTSLLPWYGVYSLYGAGDQRHTLEVRKSGVWFDGSQIKGYKIAASKLTWDTSGTPANASSGSLTFSVSDAGAGDANLYYGPICKGDVTVTGGAKLTGLKGKRRVYSKAGVTGSDTSTDSLDFWVGHYGVRKIAAGTTAGFTKPDLIIDAKGGIDFGGAVTAATFLDNVLSWEGGATSQNTSTGNVRFDLSADGTKRFRGSLVPDSEAGTATDTPLNAIGTLYLDFPVAGTLEILTTALAAAIKGSPYDHVLVASGGTSPYVWSTNDKLPNGLTLIGDRISGTPTTAGVSGIVITVTDKAGATAKKALSLTVEDKGQAIVATSATVTMGIVTIITSFSSAMLFHKLKRKQEKKNIKAKADADAAAAALKEKDKVDPNSVAMKDLTSRSNPKSEYKREKRKSASRSVEKAKEASSRQAEAQVAAADAAAATSRAKAAEARRDAATDQTTRDAEDAEAKHENVLADEAAMEEENARRAAEDAARESRDSGDDAESAESASR